MLWSRVLVNGVVLIKWVHWLACSYVFLIHAYVVVACLWGGGGGGHLPFNVGVSSCSFNLFLAFIPFFN
jgi:hypothetical protein